MLDLIDTEAAYLTALAASSSIVSHGYSSYLIKYVIGWNQKGRSLSSSSSMENSEFPAGAAGAEKLFAAGAEKLLPPYSE